MKFNFASNLKPVYLILLGFTFFLVQCQSVPWLVSSKVKTSENFSREPAAETKNVTRSLASLKFEYCVSEPKLYLEDQILRMSQDLYLDHDNDWAKKIPIQCIQFAQKNYQGSFAYCQSETDKPRIGAPRPCLTENYTRLVYNAYHDVMNCFGLDPRVDFLQIMIESGFHVNAINKSGFDAGVAQFTKNGMLRVMETPDHGQSLVNKTARLLSESTNPSCSRIASAVGQLSPDAFKVEQRCQMMALPKNPYRGFLMHYLHGLRDQIFFKEQLIKIRPELEPILSKQVIQQLVYFAYNRGITGTLRLIDGYYKNRKAVGQDLKLSDFNLWQNLSDIRRALKDDPSLRRKINSSKFKKLSFPEYALLQNQPYMANMSEARDFVKRYTGTACVD